MEKKIKLAATEGKNKEIFKALPPKVCGSHADFQQSTINDLLAGFFLSPPGASDLDLSLSPPPRPTHCSPH